MEKPPDARDMPSANAIPVGIVTPQPCAPDRPALKARNTATGAMTPPRPARIGVTARYAFTKVTQLELSPNFEADHEEEERHEAAVHPEPQRVGRTSPPIRIDNVVFQRCSYDGVSRLDQSRAAAAAVTTTTALPVLGPHEPAQGRRISLGRRHPVVPDGVPGDREHRRLLLCGAPPEWTSTGVPGPAHACSSGRRWCRNPLVHRSPTHWRPVDEAGGYRGKGSSDAVGGQRSGPDEVQQVGVDRLGLGRGHAMGKAGVRLEDVPFSRRAAPTAVPNRRTGRPGRRHRASRAQGTVIPFQVLREVGLGEGNDAVVVRLRTPHHPLAPPVFDEGLGGFDARPIEAVEGARRQAPVEAGPATGDLGLEIVEHALGEASRDWCRSGP